MLSERMKNWLAGPKALITVVAVIGLLGWGFKGLLIGAAGGFILAVLIGIVLRRISGGMIPGKARRALVKNVLDSHPEAVRNAYPELEGQELFSALEDDFELIAKRATVLAPTNEDVWFAQVFMTAAHQVAQEQESSERRRLFEALAARVHVDWYTEPRGA